MLRRKIVESQEFHLVFDEAVNGFAVLWRKHLAEVIQSTLGLLSSLRRVDVFQEALRLALARFWQFVDNVACLVDPAALMLGFGIHFAKSGPEAKGTITSRDFWANRKAAALEIRAYA